jgi:hypothetical protein
MQRKVSLALILLGLAPLLQAGEYSVWSPGIQINVARAVQNTFVPFQSTSGNIQGADVTDLYGIGLANQIRLGELFSWKVRSLVWAPTLGVHLGRESETRNDANLNFYGTDGSVVSVQGATSTRRTNTREIFFAAPLRWYAVSGSAVYGGFYLEAGPLFVQTSQTVDLDVSGYVISVPATLSESTQIRANEHGFVVGVGATSVYRGHQFTYGLTYQGINGTTSNKVGSNQVQGHITWTF